MAEKKEYMMRIENFRAALLFAFLYFLNTCIAQPTSNKKILWTADWSPNGKYIAIGGNLDTLKIYSAKKLKLYKSYPIQHTITSVKWHPHKNILAVATQLSSDKVRILNFETDQIIELAGISADGARGLDWNYTGEYLAVADNDGKISLFNITGQLIRSVQHENTKSITGMDWHPKENIFITVGDKIRMYNIDGDLLKVINHRPEEVLMLCVAWHPTGKFFVTGDYGDKQQNYKPLLQYWNRNGELIKSIDISKGEYRNIAWNNNGTKLATASDALRIWDEEGNLIKAGNSTDHLWGLSWNKKGNSIVTSSKEQRVIIWNKKARIKRIDE